MLQVLERISESVQSKGPDAVACALWALCRHWTSPETAVMAAVHYGNNTDTLGALTGALAGALHGCSWIPDRWWAWSTCSSQKAAFTRMPSWLLQYPRCRIVCCQVWIAACTTVAACEVGS